MSDDSAEVGIHGGVGGAVSGNDDVAGEPDRESGGDGGVEWLERVIPFCPYIPFLPYVPMATSLPFYASPDPPADASCPGSLFCSVYSSHLSMKSTLASSSQMM